MLLPGLAVQEEMGVLEATLEPQGMQGVLALMAM